MDTIRFSVYAPKPQQIVVFDFYLSGFLKTIFFNDNAKSTFAFASVSEAPIKIDYVPGVIPAQFKSMIDSGCEVKDITKIDLSFAKFWDVYGVKRGNIARTQKLWGKLSDHEKILAIGFIRKLKIVYDREGKQMPYPETYLSQRRWENEL